MKIFKVKVMLEEIVRIKIKNGIRVLDDEGVLYKHILYSTGEFELTPLSPCGRDMHALGHTDRIPFNPLNYGIDDDDYKWE